MIRRVLVGLAGTQYSSAAIGMALDVAARCGARATGVTVFDLQQLEHVGPQPIGGGGLAKELREHRVSELRERIEQVVEEFDRACRDAGVPYDLVREERESPCDYMISLSRYHDLAVLGLRNIFEYGVIGEPQEDPSLLLVRLIREGVRPIVAAGPAFRSVKRVMIAYSGSMESAKTMKQFVTLRPWAPEQVRIVTYQSDRERADRLLASAASYCRDHGLQVETATLAASAMEELLPEAHGWGADLLVLGNSARSLLRRQIFGETALHVMQHAELPLFLGQ
jgi:nucleotide-binding universal stress UspA family protein